MAEIQLKVNYQKVNKKLKFSKAQKNDKKIHFLKQKSAIFDRFLVKLDKVTQKLGNLLRKTLKAKPSQSLASKLKKSGVAKRLILLNQIYQKKLQKLAKISTLS